MKITRFVSRIFQENCYLLWDDESQEAAIVDPGMMSSDEQNQVDTFLKNNNIVLKYVLLTHAHIDHAASAEYLSKTHKAIVCAHSGETHLAQNLPMQNEMFGLGLKIQPLTIGKTLSDGDVLHVANEKIEVRHCPGHSEGGVIFYLEESGSAFVGDSIFMGSIGRTDLWGGDYDTLINSINNQILTLPDDTCLYSGHGPSTTVLFEKQQNPFLK